MAKAVFNGCEFIDNGTGIKATGDVQIESYDSKFKGNGIAVDIESEVPDEIVGLFKHGVDIQKLRLMVEEVQVNENIQPEHLAKKLKESGLSSWIANGANIVTVASAIIEFVKFISR